MAKTLAEMRREYPIQGEHQKVGTPIGKAESSGLNRAQLRMIRHWRDLLHAALVSVYDQMFDLRRRFEEQGELWTVKELMWVSHKAQKLETACEKVLKGYESRQTSKKTGRRLSRKVMGLDEFCATKTVRKSLRDRLCGVEGFEKLPHPKKQPGGAWEGLVMAIGHLRPITPGRLRERMGKQVLVTGFEPGTEEWHEQHVIEAYVMANLLDGMKAMRGTYSQLFMSITAKDVQNFKLTEQESALWYEAMEEFDHPHPNFLAEWETYVHDHGVVAHIYDHKGEFVFEAMPLWFSGDGPGSLKQRDALRQTKKARMAWGFRFDPPADVSELKERLTVEERKHLSRIIRRRHEQGLEGMPLELIAKTYGLGVTASVAPERKKWKAEEFEVPDEMKELERQYKKNPQDSAISKMDFLQHRELWNMDLNLG